MEPVLCRSCGVTKSRDEFHKASREKNGLQFRCKACDKEWHAARYLRDKEKINAQAFKWRTENAARASETGMKWRKANPDKVKEYQRTTNLRKNFGLEQSDYKAMLDEQNGVCFLCEKPETHINYKTKTLAALSVDHCHTQGHVRRLLCNNCNHALGFFKDDPELLRKAANYVEGFRK